ncbi:sigma-70 family RNA polymerase sigma factor [Chryseobacterium sp. WG14]|jgi:RNA polymerase sigma-70 factor (ECF subfamily)|uniref:RNA polymerase sigma-70 factor (ECF subfamily) n=1 Tax=Chryseobacterium rhizosphaerae TaxID=395937 RepID=A0AAE3YAJ9_9FLAO|nr:MULTISPECIES: sigma-70 family RNA polymerase sigma factor [Chryseobacterium]MBL3549666.1 sigma-70 family RNA polymerase sigma factor [Chryseobacterium sp. KMC2]MCQ9634381.1 sigma-70 family RNA polymerase sigma factor [Chryseobacterium sp. WG23]MCQ9641062.1 sigma-70 family RNA polymerase sigma factor [Chryseobacterium sp. WG14]MDR6526613.1 RNA polymerase sigma-70 factor (ECF subfamily) [Chryseobacterium rhizosphaerae]MDR6548803.1 RNA polymerase sigma-70 factor (ECF subfamily) [Chryseobacteri
MKIKDAEIISLMQNPRTQEKGVRALMDAYQSRLYWHIRRIIVDGDLAQDTLQETFIKAYQNFHQFKNDSQLYTWLYRIATNEALQQVNKMNKMKKTDEDAEYHMQNLVADNTEGSAEEIQILLQNAIQSLPEKQKLVFMMRYYDDLPYEEISKIVDMSVGTLKTNYHYAKQKIEEFIKENYER